MTMKQGFTLIELLIAMGIFAVFITIITGVFTNFIQVQRHAIAQGQLIADMTASLEAFIKEARTGYGSTYNSDGSAIAFVNQNKDCVGYRVNDNEFQRAEEDGVDDDTCEPGEFDESRYSPITSNATEITKLNFLYTPASEVGGVLTNQGVITITLEATSKKDGIPPISIQNSVTSRQMEPYVQQ